MFPLRWRQLFLLVVMVVVVTALPHQASSTASLSSKLHERPVNQSVSNEELLALLLGPIEEQDGTTHHSSDPPSLPSFPPSPLPQDQSTDIPVPHTIFVQSCVCAPYWQCKDKDSTPVAVTGNSFTSSVLDLRSNLGCGSPEEVCCVEVDPHVPPPIPANLTLACGRRNRLGIMNTFIGFEDQQTQFGEFPWTVAITSSGPHSSDAMLPIIAGGSLVHPQMVLSVAHNFINYIPDDLTVRLGDWNLAKETEAIPYQEINVVKIVIHEAYSGEPNHYYDVVLLVLEHPAVLSTTVNTICLPLTEQNYLHDKCIVTGWGKRNFSTKNRFQEVMKAVTMPLARHDTCQAAMQKTRLGSSFILHDTFLCAGGEVEGQDSCTGDGGSPLVCPLQSDSTRYVQVGVVAWGIGCGTKGVPGVYVDVFKIGTWVDQVLGEEFGASREEETLRKPSVDIRLSTI